MQFKQWLKRNVLFLFSSVLGIILGSIALHLLDIGIFSKDMLQSLIQAEATVLGFFGIIVSYVLISYDTRLDRLEQQRFDCELANKPQAIAFYNEKFARIQEHKKVATNSLGLIGFVFILSLLLSILALGAIDNASPLFQPFSYFSISCFFVGIFGLVLSFIAISKEP